VPGRPMPAHLKLFHARQILKSQNRLIYQVEPLSKLAQIEIAFTNHKLTSAACHKLTSEALATVLG
jgi:hypothetical protein